MMFHLLSPLAAREAAASPLRFIRPVQSEEDYAAVMQGIDALIDAPEGSPEAEVLSVLTTLAHAWEEEHHAIPPADPVHVLRFFLEQNGLTERDLEPHIGSRARVWEVLHGKRPLTIRMIRNLTAAFPIPAEALLGRGSPAE